MDIALSLLVLGSIALVIGAWFMFRRGSRKQGWLMLILAVIMALNVAIWTVPMQSGTVPSQAVATDAADAQVK
ncbi:hypothetical protein [Novosphingobium sp. 9U]|uniref:hypothetical protein n=1 Tax=Novosphingobium sp. 9U TaxID=2653158 RepID=UPI0012F384E1|nr:hypothetical protein [Novosphingobium sp. 9U]VWX52298.1 conserved hypothetical protein [Novosphingobium sp. 9U]